MWIARVMSLCGSPFYLNRKLWLVFFYYYDTSRTVSNGMLLLFMSYMDILDMFLPIVYEFKTMEVRATP